MRARKSLNTMQKLTLGKTTTRSIVYKFRNHRTYQSELHLQDRMNATGSGNVDHHSRISSRLTTLTITRTFRFGYYI